MSSLLACAMGLVKSGDLLLFSGEFGKVRIFKLIGYYHWSKPRLLTEANISSSFYSSFKVSSFLIFESICFSISVASFSPRFMRCLIDEIVFLCYYKKSFFCEVTESESDEFSSTISGCDIVYFLLELHKHIFSVLSLDVKL